VREKQPARVHRVTITGLQPYTRYAYSVQAAGHRSDGTFRTAPSPGGSFRFAAYGDTRTQPERHAEVLASMLKFQPDFALQTGDLVENGASLPQWAEFFQVAAPMLRQVPYYPAEGNHELGGSPFFRYFPGPRDYSFDYGCAHFVVLDSNRPPPEWRAQETWLREDLQRSQGAAWRIVALHHTLFTASPGKFRRADSIRLFRRLIGILHDQHVGLVISGHEHNYEHFFSRGIHYLVTGGGGAPLVPPVRNAPFAVTVKMAHHHCELTVNPQRIAVRAVEPTGTEIERFEIQAP
jgi:3',5'-cyclic AMP phosphodiesterase CpdA